MSLYVDLSLAGSAALPVRTSFARGMPWESLLSQARAALQLPPDAVITGVAVGGARLDSLEHLNPAAVEKLVVTTSEAPTSAPLTIGAQSANAGASLPGPAATPLPSGLAQPAVTPAPALLTAAPLTAAVLPPPPSAASRGSEASFAGGCFTASPENLQLLELKMEALLATSPFKNSPDELAATEFSAPGRWASAGPLAAGDGRIDTLLTGLERLKRAAQAGSWARDYNYAIYRALRDLSSLPTAAAFSSGIDALLTRIADAATFEQDARQPISQGVSTGASPPARQAATNGGLSAPPAAASPAPAAAHASIVQPPAAVAPAVAAAPAVALAAAVAPAAAAAPAAAVAPAPAAVSAAAVMPAPAAVPPAAVAPVAAAKPRPPPSVNTKAYRAKLLGNDLAKCALGVRPLQPAQPGSVHHVLCLDVSGSMQSDDGIKVASKVARGIASRVQPLGSADAGPEAVTLALLDRLLHHVGTFRPDQPDGWDPCWGALECVLKHPQLCDWNSSGGTRFWSSVDELVRQLSPLAAVAPAAVDPDAAAGGSGPAPPAAQLKLLMITDGEDNQSDGDLHGPSGYVELFRKWAADYGSRLDLELNIVGVGALSRSDDASTEKIREQLSAVAASTGGRFARIRDVPAAITFVKEYADERDRFTNAANRAKRQKAYTRTVQERRAVPLPALATAAPQAAQAAFEAAAADDEADAALLAFVARDTERLERAESDVAAVHARNILEGRRASVISERAREAAAAQAALGGGCDSEAEEASSDDEDDASEDEEDDEDDDEDDDEYDDDDEEEDEDRKRGGGAGKRAAGGGDKRRRSGGAAAKGKRKRAGKQPGRPKKQARKRPGGAKRT